MTNSLSEQVAELEAELALCKMIHSYPVAKSRQKYADEWLSLCAELDLNPDTTRYGSVFSAIRERAGIELGIVEDFLDEARAERDQLEAERDDLQRQVQEARDEVDALTTPERA